MIVFDSGIKRREIYDKYTCHSKMIKNMKQLIFAQCLEFLIMQDRISLEISNPHCFDVLYVISENHNRLHQW